MCLKSNNPRHFRRDAVRGGYGRIGMRECVVAHKKQRITRSQPDPNVEKFVIERTCFKLRIAVGALTRVPWTGYHYRSVGG